MPTPAEENPVLLATLIHVIVSLVEFARPLRFRRYPQANSSKVADNARRAEFSDFTYLVTHTTTARISNSPFFFGYVGVVLVSVCGSFLPVLIYSNSQD
ncbi:hypothetical protein GALMADRAFT_222907 [Galerina marginata CBS 339.88]|uniref:Uncharacterized protein n=1 Tax=Galerina marginata (strain CBS 339.88) TaxID=685588 RepID=A0A067TA50_GALM3|nr:hypothetical protein GALMADRAFT_222907 [Galerina marginata CBS 339.88]